MRPGVAKLFFLLFCFLAFVGLLVGNLFKVQIIKHQHYKHIAEDQHGFIREIPAQRGAILDRSLKPLATTLPVYHVFADPCIIDDPRSTAHALAQLLPSSTDALARKLRRKDSRYELIELAVDVERGMELKRLGLRGVCVEPAGKRVRPLGALAVNIVGCLSAYEEALSGIELIFDEDLRGVPGLRRYLRDALGNPRPCVEAVIRSPVAGNSVVLTIDADLQRIAERALEQAVRKHLANGGCVIVVDPVCGDILAMASMPTGQNFPVRSVFEPGSALKICTLAAALDLGIVDTTDVFDTNGGKLKIPGGWIRDDHPVDHPVCLREGFAISSNVMASSIAKLIGRNDFYRYLRAFGLGAWTDLPLEGESRGILREPDDWSRRSLETLGIGQEIGVTAIQLTMAYSVIANGGRLVRPRLVKAIIDGSGKVIERYPAKAVRRVIRKETATKMISLLETAVQEGTGAPACIEGIRVAGKTGTGQKAERGRYVAGKYYSVFAGLVPADDPRYVCLVVMDEPSAEAHYGGPVCGPVFRQVMEAFLRRKKTLLPENCLRLTERGGNAAGPVSAVASSAPANLCDPCGASPERRYPSVLGLTLKEATQVLERAGVKWRASGTGVVVDQRPQPGAPLGECGVCILTLDLVG
jgi:cell division protein FtsI/penicillin-binding protein 2